MKRIFGWMVALTIVLAPVPVVAQPKLKLTASRMTGNGTGITVTRDERVSIQIAAEEGSTVAIFCIPRLVYITPPNKTEVTFYASTSVQFMIAAFKDGKVNQQEILVTVGTDPAPPGPKPPGPKPPDPPPPGPDVPTSKIGKATYEAAIKVTGADRAADAATIAKGMRATHAKAVAVATMKWQDIIKEAMMSVEKIPAANRSNWGSWGIAVLGALTVEITGTDAEKRIKAIAAVAEMAKAMEAVR